MDLINKFSDLKLSHKLFVLFSLALILRLIAYYTHPYIHSDSVTYLSINFHDTNGELQKGLDIHRQLPPAILYFMRVFTILGINVEFGYRFTSVLFYSFALYPLFYIARHFTSEIASLFTVFCYACHPKAIDYSHAVLRESLAIPFIIYGLALLLLSHKRKRFIYSSLAGVCISVSYMSRLEYGVAFILGLLLFCILLFFEIIKDREHRKMHYLRSGVLILTMIPILLLINVAMKKHNSYWDPFAYRKVKGFLQSSFSE